VKIIIRITLISTVFFLLFDFFFGKKIIDFFEKKNFYITFDQNFKNNLTNEKKFRIKNDIFSHTLSKNYQGISYFGNKSGKLCTDENGFKSKCGKNISNNNYDYVFIGDSFTEGVGLSHEKTFVGIFEDSSKKKIANLGVSSYSPIIYFHKIRYFLEKDINMKHVIVFLDLSDIQNEMFREECNGKVCNKNQKSKKDFKSDILTFKFKNFLKNDFKFTLLTMQYLKREFCKNILISRCSYVYDKNFERSNWIHEFEKNISINGKYNDSFNQTIFYLDQIQQILEQKEIDFSLAIYPWPGNIFYNKNTAAYQNYFQKYCKIKCKYFFNYFDDFEILVKNNGKNKVIKDYFFYGDMHFNEKGNYVIAKKLINYLN